MSWTPLQVRALRLEAEDVLGVELAPPGPAPLPFDWAPGAHVDLRLGNGVVRQYSVVSLPEDGHVYLGIKREKASRGGSQWLHEHLRLVPGWRWACRATSLACNLAQDRSSWWPQA